MGKQKSFFQGLIILPVFALVFIAVTSCKHDAVNSNDFRTIYFDTEVLPIFQSNCAGCHNGSQEMALNSYQTILAEVTPGDPKNSNAYSAIISSFINPMPPNGPLTQYQRTLINLWIIQGAKDTKAPVVTDTTSTTDTTAAVSDEDLRVCFSRDILPVVLSSCASTNCHNSTTHQGDIVLENYNNVKSLVTAGSPSGSKFYRVITATGEDMMPPTGALPKATIDSIYSWIKGGATNGTCTTLCDTTAFTYSAVKTIIANNCLGCHSTATTQNKNISLSTYALVAAVATSGQLTGTINHTGSYPQMPPTYALTTCQKTIVRKWVNAGALNN